MLRKLGAYPRQNALAIALRELGKLERTSFLLEYIRDVELRRRIHIGLNKGEARNALARAVFFNRLGELRDRTLENQQHRASGLNLVVAAIVLWNTVYLERAIQALRNQGQMIPEALLVHLSPLKWEHINLTGDYHWRRDGGLRNRKLRPLRNAFAPPTALPIAVGMPIAEQPPAQIPACVFQAYYVLQHIMQSTLLSVLPSAPLTASAP